MSTVKKIGIPYIIWLRIQLRLQSAQEKQSNSIQPYASRSLKNQRRISTRQLEREP